MLLVATSTSQSLSLPLIAIANHMNGHHTQVLFRLQIPVLLLVPFVEQQQQQLGLGTMAGWLAVQSIIVQLLSIADSAKHNQHNTTTTTTMTKLNPKPVASQWRMVVVGSWSGL